MYLLYVRTLSPFLPLLLSERRVPSPPALERTREVESEMATLPKKKIDDRMAPAGMVSEWPALLHQQSKKFEMA
jgi:hypothetical protein